MRPCQQAFQTGPLPRGVGPKIGFDGEQLAQQSTQSGEIVPPRSAHSAGHGQPPITC